VNLFDLDFEFGKVDLAEFVAFDYKEDSY